MKTVFSVASVATLLVAASGCEATIGPYVTDVQQNANGDLVVYRCTTHVSRSGNIDHYETKDCTQKVLPYPRTAGAAPTSTTSAASETPVPPTAKSSDILIGP